MSATSLVFSSKLSLPSTLLLTTSSHLVYVVRHVKSIDNSHVNHHNHIILHPSKKTSTDVILPNVSDLPGLLLQVVLAVHAVVDHQLTFTLCGQTC